MQKLLKRIMLFTILFTTLGAQFSDTVPTTSWIYTSIEKLQIAGYMNSLTSGNRPYTRKNILHALEKIDPASLSNKRLKIAYRRLQQEFEAEIRIIKNHKLINSEITGRLQFLNNSQHNNDLNNYFKTRASANFNLLDNFLVKYSAIIDNSLSADPYYDGYEWRGFMGYQDQIYMAYNNDSFELKFGRDYTEWGYGKNGNLLISDNSRPLDMFSLKVRSKYIKFHSFLSQLDPMYAAERYLTAIRIEINPISNLHIGLGQAALYGGENRSIDFTISNPISFYSFTQDNDQKPLNEMAYFDMAYYFLNNYKFYGEFLIDDFQIDSGERTTLEPNELGIICGLEAIDLGAGLGGWVEFTQIRNRTYNVQENHNRPFEKYLHKNQYIGHKLGNDFRSLQLEITKWFNTHFKSGLGYFLLKQGEGTVRGKFKMPWMDEDYNVEKGYNEPIPFGTVETTNQFYLNLHYEPTTNFQIDTKLGFETIDNQDNQKGVSTSNFYGQLSLWLNIEKIYPLN